MINNLFSSFDPINKSINPLILYWLVIFAAIKIPKKKKTSILLLTHKIITKKKKIKTSKTSIKWIFLTVIWINLYSLTPFSWSFTSNIIFNLFIIIILYIPTSLLNLNKWIKFREHIVPKSTPLPLIPPIVLIETTGWIIRPITLIIRLSTNILSGHLIIHLIRSFIINLKKQNLIIPSILIICLIILETIVSLIQAFIIITLLRIYNE